MRSEGHRRGYGAVGWLGRAVFSETSPFDQFFRATVGKWRGERYACASWPQLFPLAGNTARRPSFKLTRVLLPRRGSMNALLVYPEFPDTYWSFKHALKFLGKQAAQPPLGLMTVAALLPATWNKRLVDTNVERLRDRDLAWADVVLLSGMHIQRDSLRPSWSAAARADCAPWSAGPSPAACRPPNSRRTTWSSAKPRADCRPGARSGARHGQARLPGRRTAGDGNSPLPDLSLIKMRRYSTMAVQYSRGCPFNCEFCDIIEIYGRRPRTKAVAQVMAELDQLRAAGWREAVFIVDDNFIGNKARAKELCMALAEWRSQYKISFDFNTEASLNLADDPELMQLMKDAGFVSVFLGIETPDESGLIASQQAAEHAPQPARQRGYHPELRHAGDGRLHPRLRHRSRRHLRPHGRVHSEERHPHCHGRPAASHARNPAIPASVEGRPDC